jgi:hypothetical protein
MSEWERNLYLLLDVTVYVIPFFSTALGIQTFKLWHPGLLGTGKKREMIVKK